jgi:hypothetical protein
LYALFTPALTQSTSVHKKDKDFFYHGVTTYPRELVASQACTEENKQLILEAKNDDKGKHQQNSQA